CQKICAGWPAGTTSDTANTLACRVYHASLVASGAPAAVHCPHAGPFGGDACGTHCVDFCELALATCGSAAFSSAGACTGACASWPRATPQVTASGPTSGNTFDCRAYELTAAVTSPGAHCANVASVSVPCR